MPVLRREKNAKLMKNNKTSEIPQPELDDLRSEYEFDYSKSRPNRFAGQVPDTRPMIMLDPDVAEVFTSSESVNGVLRALIANMPGIRSRS